MDGGKIMQKYNRVYREPIYFPYKELNCYNDLHGRICIEIKQTKEDMEENRTINQQFAECEQTINDVVRKCYTENKSTQIKDMEEYKIHDAKEDIPEFDKVVDECLFGKQELKLKPFDLQKAKAGKPVCTRDGRKARIICFDKRGKFPIIALIDEGDIEVHYYYSHNGKSADCVSDYDLMMLPEKKEGWVNVYKDSVYETKDDALIGRSESRGYIDTIKISWEE